MPPQHTDFTEATCTSDNKWLSCEDVTRRIPGTRPRGVRAGMLELALFPYMVHQADASRLSVAKLDAENCYVAGAGNRSGGVAYLAFEGDAAAGRAALAKLCVTDRDDDLQSLMERVPGDAPVRLFLDLEGHAEAHTQLAWLGERVNKVIDQVNKLLPQKMKHIRSHGGVWGDLAVASACRTLPDGRHKMSFHVTFPTIVFETVAALRAFAHGYLCGVDGVDQSVYAGNRFFRLPGQRKLNGGEDTRLRALTHTTDPERHMVTAAPNTAVTIATAAIKPACKAQVMRTRVSEGEVPPEAAGYLQRTLGLPQNTAWRWDSTGTAIEAMNPCCVDSSHTHTRSWQSRVMIHTNDHDWSFTARCRGNCLDGRVLPVPVSLDALVALAGRVRGGKRKLEPVERAVLVSVTKDEGPWNVCRVAHECVVFIGESRDRCIVVRCVQGFAAAVEDGKLLDNAARDVLMRVFLPKVFVSHGVAQAKHPAAILAVFACELMSNMAQDGAGRLYRREGHMWALQSKSIEAFLECAMVSGPCAVRDSWRQALHKTVEGVYDKARKSVTLCPRLGTRGCFAFEDGIVDLGEGLPFTRWEDMPIDTPPFVAQYDARPLTYAAGCEPPTAATSIVEAQLVDADERDLLYALFGRAICYKRGSMHDAWRCFPRIYGMAQTGKSTLLEDALAGKPGEPGVFGPNIVAIGGSNRSGTTVGCLARIVGDADVLLGTELSGDVTDPLYTDGAFCSTNIKLIASREAMNFSKLYQEDEACVVEAPTLLVNQTRLLGVDYQPVTHAELVAYWRRQVPFSFTTVVEERSSECAARCRVERASFALFCLRKYEAYRARYDQLDDIPLVREKRAALVIECHPFGRMMEKHPPERRQGAYMSARDFAGFFKDWMKPKWVRDRFMKHVARHVDMVAELKSYFGPEACAHAPFRPCVRCGRRPTACGHAAGGDNNRLVPEGALLGIESFERLVLSE